MYSYETTYYGSDAGFVTALLGMLAVVWLIALVICIIMVIAMWKLFKKAGRHGWASLIPLYNTYTIFDIAFGRGKGWMFLLMFIPFFNIYVAIKCYINLAKAYGYPSVFCIGLIFLNPIFMCIMAFSDAKYIGPGSHGLFDSNGPVPEGPSYQAQQSQAQAQPEMDKEAMKAAMRERMQKKNSPFEN